ncbi:hypothetical protein N0V91_007800 [Didymella pomorum]|uniref:Uncharacterized protein n=1 Tax=Didymella pomorum TaxID=749634 RepID=A0A9W8Z7Y9_9PLEO|nr:hypothetical protein N0V91_007800 [Didymella pomorum]
MTNLCMGAVAQLYAPVSAAPAGAPVDPSKHSLITLPPELRNQIYEAVFQPATTKRLELPIDVLKPQVPDAITVQLAVPGIKLLQTCKQINAEAAVYLNCKSKSSLGEKPYQDVDECVDGATDWLTCIGRNASFSPIVHIDLTAAEESSSVDVLPIISISPGKAGAEVFNFLLKKPRTNAEIRRFLGWHRLLSAIICESNGKSVKLVLPSPVDTYIRYHLDDSGQLLKKLMYPSIPPTFTGVLRIHDIRERIFTK